VVNQASVRRASHTFADVSNEQRLIAQVDSLYAIENDALTLGG